MELYLLDKTDEVEQIINSMQIVSIRRAFSLLLLPSCRSQMTQIIIVQHFMQLQLNWNRTERMSGTVLS